MVRPWAGIALVLLAISVMNGSQTLCIHNQVIGGSYDWLITGLDYFWLTLLAIGLIAILCAPFRRR